MWYFYYQSNIFLFKRSKWFTFPDPKLICTQIYSYLLSGRYYTFYCKLKVIVINDMIFLRLHHVRLYIHITPWTWIRKLTFLLSKSDSKDLPISDPLLDDLTFHWTDKEWYKKLFIIAIEGYKSLCLSKLIFYLKLFL